MYPSRDETRPRERSTDRSQADRARRIDCAPVRRAAPPAEPNTSRGRGTPDPDLWKRERDRSDD